MDIQAILTMCEQQSVSLSVEEGNLQVLFDDMPTDELLQHLRSNKPQIIEFMQQQQTHQVQSGNHVPLVVLDRKLGRFPVSHSQQRMWLLNNMQGTDNQNNVQAVLKINGPLQKACLQQAVNSILARHEILRTRYVESADGVQQEIVEVAGLPLIEHDLIKSQSSLESQTGIATDDLNGSTVEAIIDNCARYAFDLAKAPLLRANLICVAEQEHLLALTLPMIAADGESLKILVQEVTRLYASLTDKQAANVTMPELSFQYADYASWHREYLQSDGAQASLQYWRDTLVDLPQLHSLPTDHARPVAQQYEGEVHSLACNPALAQKLEKLATNNQTSLFVLLQTAFALLVARWSNEQRIVIGTPVAGRTQSQLQHNVGYFANNLVNLTQFSDEHTFIDVLSANKVSFANALDHQDIPYEYLVENIQYTRTQSHTPLFQIMFRLQHISEQLIQTKDTVFSLYPYKQSLAKFDLDLCVNQSESGLSFSWTYAKSIFQQASIERLSEAFIKLLEGIVVTPQANIYDYPIASESDLAKIAAYNDTDIDFAETVTCETSMHGLFIQQVTRQPSAIAVRDQYGTVSYEALLRAAYGLAQRLKEYDLQQEELIAVRLPKGREQAIATLGILMAGAAYLPLEENWPAERCDNIISQAGCRLLVSHQESPLLLSEKLTCIDVHSIEPCNDELASILERVPTEGMASQLAYVIFTSGSTGKPKGVAIEHGMAVNTLLDINRKYSVTEKDSVLAVSALSFDLSVYDLFGLLAAGGEVIYPNDHKASDPNEWMQLLEQHNITLWNSVPASADLLTLQFEMAGRVSTAPLRIVMMSGDWIPTGLPSRLWQRFEQAKVYSLGGATEGSIWSIHYPITQDCSNLPSVPYGMPLANQYFYVLNKALQPVPLGCQGDLYIGGKGVAREYFNDSQRTQGSFIWHERLQQRLYKTGDLGRLLSEGYIEFLGRSDNQVKILGFRIEMGEIEAQLSSAEQIEKAVVIALGERQDKKLVAYIVPTLEHRQADEEQFLIRAMQERLAVTLPAYMMPSAFVVLHELPLTANGKLDLKALPEAHFFAPTQMEAAQTDTEQQLANIWKAILGVDEICVAANFFELGGNSLQLSRLIYEAQEAFQVELNMMEVFELATIRTIAQCIDDKLLSQKLSSIELDEQRQEQEVLI
ncbi:MULTISPECIES: non-ribosomal peptide synthetase [unclassified Pseudoalteromonas]|uniref:non-ribosomal peptide synthetase n=1 Tax=unclassified Pseudoalteromonas TaxID=194690 RepID=UPI0004129DAA|nr:MULTISPECIES: non-ribosomal peptide synthetase [unclassified Pseudoalteromonas]PCC14221.1 non-ribosomal peptide synthetase [Pseudoalteromonas sp. JB197]SJN16308.1 Peptide synthetase [Pseudoalteromonas sp. JB197]